MSWIILFVLVFVVFVVVGENSGGNGTQISFLYTTFATKIKDYKSQLHRVIHELEQQQHQDPDRRPANQSSMIDDFFDESTLKYLDQAPFENQNVTEFRDQASFENQNITEFSGQASFENQNVTEFSGQASFENQNVTEFRDQTSFENQTITTPYLDKIRPITEHPEWVEEATTEDNITDFHLTTGSSRRRQRSTTTTTTTTEVAHGFTHPKVHNLNV